MYYFRCVYLLQQELNFVFFVNVLVNTFIKNFSIDKGVKYL